MKKFLLRSGSLVAIIMVTMIGTLFLMPNNKAHYVYAHHNKMQTLDTLPSPRLILVGGSNLAFGLNSEAIEDSLGVNVLNTATHASIGLRFMLDEVMARLRPDDVVVIMPEYSQFYGSYCGSNESLTNAVMFSGSKAFSRLNYAQWQTFIGGIPKHIKGNLNARAPGAKWGYSAIGFNRWGDEAAHWTAEKTGEVKANGKISRPIDAYAVKDTAYKIKQMEDSGIIVILFWPITIESNFEAQHDAVESIDAEFQKYGILFSNDPAYFVQPDSLAFDTPYHMSLPAVKSSTERFIEVYRMTLRPEGEM